MNKVIKKIIPLQLVIITIIVIIILNKQIIEKSNIAKKLNEGVKQSTTEKTFTEEDFPYNIKFKDIAAANSASFALDEEGYLWSWGFDGNMNAGRDRVESYTGVLGDPDFQYKERIYPKKISKKKFSKIYSGYHTIFAIDEEGYLYGWGQNSSYQLGDGTSKDKNALTPIKSNLYFSSIDTSNYITAGIDENGEIWIWGRLSCYYYNNRTDEQYVGTEYTIPTKISDASKVKFIDVAVTNSACAAIDEEGNIWTYGYNGETYNSGPGSSITSYLNKGVLGNKDVTKPETLVQLTKITNDVVYKQIHAGEHHIIAKDEDNHLWAWGYNKEGQLGFGNTTQYNVPTLITNKRAFKEMDINENSCIAIDINGDVYTWGESSNYQLGDESSSNKTSMSKIDLDKKFKKCAISNTHSLILAEDGTLYGVGNGSAIGTNNNSRTYIQITNPNSSYNITFMDGENIIDTQTIQEGQSATAPVLTKEGYTLSWDKDFSNITSELIVNAIWTPNVYKITLNANGGTTNSGNIANYTYGKGTTLPTDVIKTGYTFDGWYEDISLTGNRVTSITNTDIGDKTYYAKWIANIYTVTLNKNGGNINSGSITSYTYGQGATLPTNVTKQGYVFRGWFESEACEGTAKTTITTTDIGNKTYYAKWLVDTDGDGIPDIEDDDTQVPYKVEHYIQNTDLRTYTLKEIVDKVEGTENKLTGNLGHEVTAVAKQYTGFRENQTAEGRVASGIVVVDGSLTLKLYYDREVYNVTLNTNAGGVTGAQISEGKEITNYTYGIGANLPTLTEVTKAFYVFRGWFENENCEGTAVTKITETDMGAKTYYAKWLVDTDGDGIPDIEDDDTQVPYKIEHYKQKLDKTGYDLAETQTTIVVTNEETGAQETKTLTGNLGHEVTAVPRNYTGFTENQTVTGRVASGIVVVDGSLTLKLYYDRETYNVTLNTNVGGVTGAQIAEGKEITNYTYGIGANLPTLTEVTKAFYVFRGWFENENCEGTAVSKITQTDTGNKIYYAKWLVDTDGDGIPDIEDDDTQVPYKVQHYVQNTDLRTYTLKETVDKVEGTENKLTGNLGHEVTAVPRNYTGFTENQTAEGRVASGIVVVDGSLTLKLYYDRETYNVTLNTNVEGVTGAQIAEGKEITNYTYGIGANLPTLTEVTKAFYVFRGWFENENCEGTAVSKITQTDTGNKTYYAKWLVDTDGDGIPDIEDDDTQVPYKVQHYVQNTDLRTYTLKETVDKVEETENKLTGNLGNEVTAVAKQYTGFRENQTAEGRVASGIVVVDGSLTLKLYYDRETYNVTLNTNVGGVTGVQIAEGKEITNYTYGIGANLPTLTEVTKAFYVFRGWFENENCEGTAVTKITETDMGAKTYYAKWLVDTDGDGIPDIEDDDTQVPYKIEHYKQKLDKTGYDLAETQTTIVVTNEETGAQETKLLTGNLGHEVTAVPRNYTGFTENQTVTGRVPNGIVVVDGSLTLKLYYDRNSYKLPLDVDGNKEEIDYVYGEEVPLPTDKEKPGYTFEGWYDNEDLTGEKVEKVDTNEIDPENPPTHYIKWTANTNTPYKVEHYLRTLDNEVIGYELIETQNLTGTTDTKAIAQPKEYRGCTENTQYEERKPEGNIAGNGSLVLKLYYERNKYQINYELNGGTTRSPLNKSYTYGEEVILSNRIEKEGYIFGGWYENSECTGQAVTSIKETDVGDKTYYAKWVKEEDAPFTITSNKYKIEDETKYITKVSPNTNKETFMKNITTNGNMKVLNKQGSEIQNNDLVGTGYTLQVEYKGTKYEYIIGVRGDLDGNGQITATDLSTLNQKLTNKIKLTGILEKSADIDFDGQITVTDLSTLNQALIKKVTL